MAKAKARACLKKKNGKKSAVVVLAPAGTTFKSTTKASAATDGTNPYLVDSKLSANLKKMLVILTGTATVSKSKKGSKPGTIITDPDPGSLVITLSDPPVGVETTTEPLPVEYVDDTP